MGWAGSGSAAADPPPETKRIRLNKIRSICLAPVYVAEALLRAEGFTDIQYFGDGPTGIGGLPAAQALGEGVVDFSMNFAAPLAVAVDSGVPITILAGVHPGCFELFGTEHIRTILDLKGKTIASPGVNSAQHLFLASIATSVGLDAERDINWVTYPPAQAHDVIRRYGAYARGNRPGDVDHLFLTSLIDRKGMLRVQYLGYRFEPQDMLRDLQALLRE